MLLSISCFSLTIAMFAFFCTVILLKLLIPILKSHKVGQKIYEIGPRWHLDKQGTPVMGGIAFGFPILFDVILFTFLSLAARRFTNETDGLCVAILALGNGLIGFIDDYTKLIKKQNQGLKAWQKLALQLVFNGACVAIGALTGVIDTTMLIPFVGKTVDLGFFYYILLVFFISAVTNAVNLTDGIDGLAASVTGIVALFFTVYAVIGANIGLASIGAAAFGGCAGFLVYNAYPARIFMGDTGSLFLGGVVSGLCVITKNPLIILLVGIIYVIEELSVILQVSYFKITHGKRIFKMAPIHHHFEKCGWSERVIVLVFSALTIVGCAIAWFGMN